MFFPFFALCALSLFPTSAYGAVRFRHEAFGVQREQQQKQLDQQMGEEVLEKRQLIVPSVPSSVLANILTLAVEEATPSPAFIPSTPVSTIYSVYYPSPSASPTPITQQSQVETTYVPRITTCKGPPVAFEIYRQTRYPFHNYTSTIYGNGPITCDTLYYTETTTICATTLTGVASRITVSECTQDVTFSSDFGITTVTPRSTVTDDNGDRSTITAAPSPQLRTTYYLAPWQSIAASVGILPTDVDVKVCHQRPGNDTIEDCIRMEESWAVLPVTLTSTYTSSVDLLATLTEGPGEYVVGTIHGQFVGNATIVSLSTEMILNYAYDAETISRGPRVGPFATESVTGVVPEDVPATVTQLRGSPGALSTIRSTSTTTRTRVVEIASSLQVQDEETTILTAQSTATVYSGTSTLYDDDSPLTEIISFVDFPSESQTSVENNPLAFETPSPAALFVESYSSTPEAAPETTLDPESEAGLIPTPPDFLFDNSFSTPESTVETPSLVLSSKVLTPTLEAIVSTPEAILSTPEAVLETPAFPVISNSPSPSPEISTTQWTPEFSPVTETPTPGETPVLVPSPAFLPPLPPFLQGLQASAPLPSSSVIEDLASAAPVQTPPVSLKWFNITTPGFR